MERGRLARLLQASRARGTAAAPEQLRGKSADARSDVHALGAALFYALNYDKAELGEPDQYEPEHAPESLREVLTRALNPKPERRYANAGEFRAALEKPSVPVTQLIALPPSAQSPPHAIPIKRQLAKPQRKAGDVYTNSLSMKFAWIPPGTFLMGSSNEQNPEDYEDYERMEETQHNVTLTKGFHLGIHQVTQAQWKLVMGSNPSGFRGESNLPVENVSWKDCVAFCKALGNKDGKTYRLPTEAAWEYACRAGTTTAFHFGDTISPDEANYDGHQTYGNGKEGVRRLKTTPVGSFPPNLYGLLDMHGNVREWCADWFEPYQKEELNDPQGSLRGDDRVVRNGSWIDEPGDCRSACRGCHSPNTRNDVTGCRVALYVD